MLILASVLLAFAFASLSNALALVLRQRESVIGVNQFMVLPLTFLSAAFMPLSLAPDWIESFARFNPANWAVEAGREALLANGDGALIGSRLLALAVVAALCGWMATGAFRTYQRSV